MALAPDPLNHPQLRLGRDEPVLEPDLPIVDSHIHLFDRPHLRYLLNDYLDDAKAGHNIVAYLGNLEYALTSRNFNPVMAMAGGVVAAEVDDVVPVGVIPPDSVMTPHVLIDYLICKERLHG